MSLEDRSEIAVAKLMQVMNFIKTVERDNYCNPAQLSDALNTLEILIKEAGILKYKLKYLDHAY